MRYLSKAEARVEAESRRDAVLDNDAKFCPYCLSLCNVIEDEDGLGLICPNEMCLYEEVERVTSG